MKQKEIHKICVNKHKTEYEKRNRTEKEHRKEMTPQVSLTSPLVVCVGMCVKNPNNEILTKGEDNAHYKNTIRHF